MTKKEHRKHKKSGRGDLYMGIGNRGFACKAKQVWCNISTEPSRNPRKVLTSLNESCDAARELNFLEGERLGICFAVPFINMKNAEKIGSCIEPWLKEIQRIEYSSIAWIFLEIAQNVMTIDGKYFYPGIVMLIKACDA